MKITITYQQTADNQIQLVRATGMDIAMLLADCGREVYRLYEAEPVHVYITPTEIEVWAKDGLTRYRYGSVYSHQRFSELLSALTRATDSLSAIRKSVKQYVPVTLTY